MINDNPYIQQNSKVQNKYSIPTNLSQQLNQQSGQDYKTPQWNNNTTQNKPQIYNQQKYQHRFEQPQFQESYSNNIGKNHQRNPYLPSIDQIDEQDEQYQQQQQQQQQYQYQEQDYDEQPQQYYEQQYPIVYPQQSIYYPPPPIYYPSQPISNPRQPLTLAGSEYRSFMKENRNYIEYPFRVDTIEDIFDKGLINLASHEKELEIAKLSLAIREDFRIIELFNLLDKNGTGSLIPEELIIGLRQFNLHPELIDILMLFDEYGINRSMDLQQFGTMIYPISISDEMTKCNNNDSIQIVPETKLYIRKVFVSLLNTEIAMETLRNEINGLDLEEMHEKIFFQNHFNDLKHYIYSKGQYFDQVTIQGVFKRLDKNGTNIISPQEFTYFFSLKNDN